VKRGRGRHAHLADWRVALALAAWVLAGCESAVERRLDAEANLRSWAATVQAVAEQWAQGHAPDGYATAVLTRAETGIRQELAALASDMDSEPLRERGRQLLAAAGELRAAIERGDAAAVRTMLGR
jgi:hypothetical protein